MEEFIEYCKSLGIKNYHDIIVHGSYRAIKNTFSISANNVILSLKNLINSKSGSIIFPAFTYCFKKTDGSNEIFDRQTSTSKVGFLSEIFRNSEDVVRTSSPTHSFSLWGNVKNFFNENNSPTSPLGKNSICEWLVNRDNSHVLMLNTDFSSFTLGHYYEIITKVPWYNFSPWRFMGVENFGVSITGYQELIEIPGCAKSFIEIEKFLLQKKLIVKHFHKYFYSYYFSIKTIHSELVYFFTNNFNLLLCQKGTCKACDERRKHFLERL